MVNVLEMPSEDVAIALGHQDGGNLVRRLYGHRDHNRALARILGAYESAANRGGNAGTASTDADAGDAGPAIAAGGEKRAVESRSPRPGSSRASTQERLF